MPALGEPGPCRNTRTGNPLQAGLAGRNGEAKSPSG
jgi:hypothetical protein